MNNDELHDIFLKWNRGVLHSFLIEITADIFVQKDELTKNRLIDMILDSAQQNGTGGWTSEDAMNLQAPLPLIDSAVSTRNLSAYKKRRQEAHQKLEGPNSKSAYVKSELVNWAEHALYFSIITAYAQGFALLQVASEKYKYSLNLSDIAGIWKGGCIIRASILEEIDIAFSKQADLSNLILNGAIAQKLMHSQIEIRKIIQIAVEMGIPMPAMMSSLSYYDAYRSDWLPANLIQAQRDYFGAHTYERNDREGIFHTGWNQKNEVEQSMLHLKKK